MNRTQYKKQLTKYLSSRPKKRIISLFLQVQWERDTAIAQLNKLGYNLGENPSKKYY